MPFATRWIKSTLPHVWLSAKRGRLVAEVAQIIRTKEKDMTNAFVHVELNSPDPQRAKAFYAKLFRCQLEDMPTLPYPIIRTL